MEEQSPPKRRRRCRCPALVCWEAFTGAWATRGDDECQWPIEVARAGRCGLCVPQTRVRARVRSQRPERALCGHKRALAQLRGTHLSVLHRVYVFVTASEAHSKRAQPWCAQQPPRILHAKERAVVRLPAELAQRASDRLLVPRASSSPAWQLVRVASAAAIAAAAFSLRAQPRPQRSASACDTHYCAT